MDTGESLNRLEGVLRAAGAPVVEYMAPGLDEATVRARLDEIGLPPGGDILSLYAWHNGVDMDRARGKPNVVAQVAPAIFLQSMDEALGDRARALEMADELARQLGTSADEHWRPEWLPVLRAHHAELFALSGTTNELWSIDWVDDPVLLYPDLATLIARLIARYDSGIYTVSVEGWSHDAELQARLEGTPRGTI